MLTAEQIRAARALVDWSQPQLAKASALSLPTIRRMEGPLGPGRSTAANVEAVRRALEDAGVVFQAADEAAGLGPGVRLKPSS
jgi:predicted transcriptional regulator